MNPMIDQPVEEEQQTDYDPFASVRAGAGITIEELPEEDYDPFASVRPEEVEVSSKKVEENPDIVRDVIEQGTKNFLIGAGGTYGDLAELAGIRAGEIPGEEQKSNIEFDILTKLKEPGYKPSLYDLESLSDQGEGLGAFNLPTSKSLEEFNELAGGPGEAKTKAGRYSGRVGKLIGSSTAFGQPNPIPGAAAGAAGQTVEEVGGGPLLQLAAEISTLLLTGAKGGLTNSNKKEVSDKINKLRELGYSEEQITLAINSASKGKKYGKSASKGSKTEQAFEDFAEHSDDLVKDILSERIPGIEKGIENIHAKASEAYGEVAKKGSGIIIKDSSPFKKSVDKVIGQIRNNLDVGEEGKAFIKRLNKAVAAAEKNPTAENYMNFYKELNSAGKWMDRSQKDRLLTEVKNGIKDTFKNEGPEGKEFARAFEQVNEGIAKAYKSQDVVELLQKTMTQDGRDFKKLNKLFDKPDNVKLFNQVLGEKQAKNLKFIAQQGKEIKDFDKAWKATTGLTKVADLARGAGATYYLYRGDMEGLAFVLGTKIGSQAARKLTEKMLTDPNYQNLLIRGLNAIKNEAPTAFRSTDEAMTKYLKELGIDLH